VVVLLGVLACQEYKIHPAADEPDAPVDTGDSAPVIDSGDTRECPEPGEGMTVPTDTGCLVTPEIGTFTPVIEWQWNANPDFDGYDDIMSTPAVGNLNDDNGDGVIDDNDIPDVVFTSFSGGAYTSPGTLTAISGDGSGTEWSIMDAGGYHIYSSGGVAIGDIDHDGIPEVCTAGVEVSVVCVTNTGAFKWGAGTAVYGYGSPSFADVDGDGQVEVIYGPEVLESDGTVRFKGTGGTGYWMSFAIDLNGDGRLEIIAGNTAYRGNGTTLWTDGTPDGAPAAGDFDLDGIPEIVHTSGGVVYLTGADGVLRWSTAIPGGGNGGPPTVADFDNDGYPEVGVAGASYYSVIDTDGTPLWGQPVSDYSSSITGSSVFDFEGDGAADVVYADELTLWVYDGATGAVKLEDDGHASGTLFEYPLIVDVDNDGSTEIVLPSNNYAYSGYNGITVIGDADNSWRPSRPIWNQYAYYITNVEDDGDIPTVGTPNWTRWNNFRTGGTTLGLSTDLADIAPGDVSVCTYRCAADGVAEVIVPVYNTGLADTETFDVSLYRNTDVVASTPLSLAAGQGVEVGPFALTRDDWGHGITVRTDAGRVIEECDETDNAVDLGPWPCE
jgi:hypothetical protein